MRKRTYELYLNKSVDGVGIHYVCTSLPIQDSLADWLENLENVNIFGYITKRWTVAASGRSHRSNHERRKQGIRRISHRPARCA